MVVALVVGAVAFQNRTPTCVTGFYVYFSTFKSEVLFCDVNHLFVVIFLKKWYDNF